VPALRRRDAAPCAGLQRDGGRGIRLTVAARARPVRLGAVALALAALALAVAACYPSGPTAQAVGVVLRIESAGLGKVSAFTIREDDGTIVPFTVGPLEPGSFPPGHLTEHAATGQPILVTYTTDTDGTHVAVKLEDKPGTTRPPWYSPSPGTS